MAQVEEKEAVVVDQEYTTDDEVKSQSVYSHRQSEEETFELVCCWGQPCIVSDCLVEICTGFEDESTPDHGIIQQQRISLEPTPDPKSVHFDPAQVEKTHKSADALNANDDDDGKSSSTGGEIITRDLSRQELLILDRLLKKLYEIRADAMPLEGLFRNQRYHENSFFSKAGLVTYSLPMVKRKFTEYYRPSFSNPEIKNMVLEKKGKFEIHEKCLKDIMKTAKSGDVSKSLLLINELESSFGTYAQDPNCGMLRHDLECLRGDLSSMSITLERYLIIKRCIHDSVVNLQAKMAQLEELAFQIGMDEHHIQKLSQSLKTFLVAGANTSSVRAFTKELECLEINCSQEAQERRDYFLDQKEGF
eukprot:TRINITY_DN9915_c0_g1_i1.p1 TRINITY_DN9915_c0_g1~~TRINITY_DN9915_c0_g1_i1.p1  ORF type:complete len:362 (-),score=70.73 TRINITY_DN9915_c0_g1_i1:13-1098(-)